MCLISSTVIVRILLVIFSRFDLTEEVVMYFSVLKKCFMLFHVIKPHLIMQEVGRTRVALVNVRHSQVASQRYSSVPPTSQVFR